MAGTTWRRIPAPVTPNSAPSIIRKIFKGMPTQIDTQDGAIEVSVIGLDSCDELNLTEWEQALIELKWVRRVEVGTVDITLSASVGCRPYSFFNISVYPGA